MWRDPPNYFEGLVWPAYVDAHRALFEVRSSPRRAFVTARVRARVLMWCRMGMSTEVRCCALISR